MSNAKASSAAPVLGTVRLSRAQGVLVGGVQSAEDFWCAWCLQARHDGARKPAVLGRRERGRLVVRQRRAKGSQRCARLAGKTPGVRHCGGTEASSRETRLETWGYALKRGQPWPGRMRPRCRGQGVWAVAVKTRAGGWALWRSWRRPQRGIAQEKLPRSPGFCEVVHNVCKRGKAWRGSLIELLVSKDPGIP
jgi:hypothetical protein